MLAVAEAININLMWTTVVLYDLTLLHLGNASGGDYLCGGLLSFIILPREKKNRAVSSWLANR